MKHDNFKPYVNRRVADKIYDLVSGVGFDALLPNTMYESYGTDHINPIEGNARSGWFPFQDGGYARSTLIRNDIDISYHVTKGQTEAVEQASKNMLDSFMLDYGIDPDEGVDYDDDDLMNKLSEYENEWHDPALLSFSVIVKEGCVGISLSVNYRDAPYYREKYGETIHEIVVDVETFMATSEQQLIETLITS